MKFLSYRTRTQQTNIPALAGQDKVQVHDCFMLILLSVNLATF